MASGASGWMDTGGNLAISGSVVKLWEYWDWSNSRVDNTVYISVTLTVQYARVSGGISSFTYGTGWDFGVDAPAGSIVWSGFYSGTRNVNQNYVVGGVLSGYAVSVGANDTTYPMQARGKFRNDGWTGAGTYNMPIDALGAPSITSTSVTNIQQKTATINSSFSAGANSSGIASVQVQYGLTTGYGSTASGTTANLTNLKPGQTYHYRFVTTNNGGKSVTTGDYTFKTKGIAGHTPVLMELL